MNNKDKNVPEVVIKRLGRYYRYLSDFLDEGETRISSSRLSEKMKVTASQIRQDFNYFGGFGQQGYGYNVEYLHSAIEDILGIKNGYRAVIIGAGHLGMALANHASFEKRGFTITALFDCDKKKIGTVINSKTVYSMDNLKSYIRENNISIAILALPKTEVYKIIDDLAEYGIKGVLNFSSAEIDDKIPYYNQFFRYILLN